MEGAFLGKCFIFPCWSERQSITLVFVGLSKWRVNKGSMSIAAKLFALVVLLFRWPVS